MAAYPELNSHDQNVWNKLFAGFSKELLFLQSKYPDYGKFYKIFYGIYKSVILMWYTK